MGGDCDTETGLVGGDCDTETSLVGGDCDTVETGLVGGDCTVVGGGYWAVGTFLLSRKVELTWRVGAVDLKRLKLLVIVEMGNDGNSFGGAVRK